MIRMLYCLGILNGSRSRRSLRAKQYQMNGITMKNTQTIFCALLLVLLSVNGALAGNDGFTGYQIDDRGQYFAFLGVRAPITAAGEKFQPFVQVLGAGYRYTFKYNGQNRDADVQFATPSIGLKYFQGPWTFIGLAGPQFRWKQEDQGPGVSRSSSDDIGAYLQGEAFYWHERGTFHAIASYTDLDKFFWGRLRGTRLVYENGGPCCSIYLGGDMTGMGNKDFYSVLIGPLVQVPIKSLYVTVRGGYQYTQTFQNGGYGGIELYLPF